MAPPRPASASGAGESFCRLAMALSAMPLFGPSLAGRSNSTVSTPAFVSWAAIWAPMTPAPSTAALRMRSVEAGRDAVVMCFLRMLRTRSSLAGMAGKPPLAQSGSRKTYQVLGGLLVMRLFADIIGALDHAEAGHGQGQRAGDQVHPPIQFHLVQVGQQACEFGGEAAHHVAIVLGQEFAEALITLGKRTRQHAHETFAANVVGDFERRADVGVEHLLQRGVRPSLDVVQRGHALRIELVQATPQHLFNQLLFAAEVVADCSKIHACSRSELPQRRAIEATPREQFFSCPQ